MQPWHDTALNTATVEWKISTCDVSYYSSSSDTKLTAGSKIGHAGYFTKIYRTSSATKCHQSKHVPQSEPLVRQQSKNSVLLKLLPLLLHLLVLFFKISHGLGAMKIVMANL